MEYGFKHVKTTIFTNIKPIEIDLETYDHQQAKETYSKNFLIGRLGNRIAWV